MMSPNLADLSFVLFQHFKAQESLPHFHLNLSVDNFLSSYQTEENGPWDSSLIYFHFYSAEHIVGAP